MSTPSEIKIQFLGAAGTVTGSKYFIQTPYKNIMVDCGLFQGLKELRSLNWTTLPIDASKGDVVLLTDGHLDHTGFLPRLVKEGFKGEIWGTKPTLEIAKIILEDSARVQEEDAERANAEGYSRHRPAKPLYDCKDVENTLPLFRPQALDKWIPLAKNTVCRFRYNGHIIGATFIELKIRNRIIVFSGDIGREDDVLMHPPQKPEKADILFIESTYGNRIHPKNAEERLASVINKSIANQGTIIIPSFAVERTQTLMYLLWKLRKKGAIPGVPVYMDSPMGNSVLDVFRNNPTWHKLSEAECKEIFKDIRLIRTIQETYKLAALQQSKIIIAGSGMVSGGRVLTYLVQYLGKPDATILLAGYQAEGTRGRALLDGAKEIKLFGKYFPVRANIETIQGLSSHADQHGLTDWLSKLSSSPAKIFIVHGEHEGSVGLRNKIKEVYEWNAAIPKLNQLVTIR